MIRTGIGWDVHRFETGRRLVLGGVVLKHERGLVGHSDADVLTHAIMDALLGAVADGDIGQHFPDSDPEWKDACSLDLLESVVARLKNQGWRTVNVDATVMAEEPKIMPYADVIRGKLAEAMGIDKTRVSVKATTLEGLGALGRGEGMAAMSVATVESVRK